MAVQKTSERPSIEDLKKAQVELLAQARRSLEAARAGKTLPPDLSIQQKKARLERARRRLADLEQARARAIARYDHEIVRHQELSARLEREVAEEKKRQKGPPKRLAGDEQVEDDQLIKIRGLGPKRILELRKHRISRVPQVAALEPARLAAILSISEKLAADIIAEARRLSR